MHCHGDPRFRAPFAAQRFSARVVYTVVWRICAMTTQTRVAADLFHIVSAIVANVGCDAGIKLGIRYTEIVLVCGRYSLHLRRAEPGSFVGRFPSRPSPGR